MINSMNAIQAHRFTLKRVIFLTILFNIFSFQLSYSQWQTEVRLTNDPASSTTGFSGSRSIAAEGSTIHVVWYDNRDGNNEIYYKRSSDNGSSWSADTRLTNDAANSLHPSITVSGLSVHLVWSDYRNIKDDIYYKRSSDGGLTWGADTRIVASPSGVYHYPCIAASGSNLHLVFFDRRDSSDGFDAEIYYKNSTDNGDTWSADVKFNNGLGHSYIPVVAVSGSNVHVAWYDSTNGNYEIYYKRSTDNGASWGANVRLTNDPGNSRWPSIAVSGTFVHVVWADMRNSQFKIYYKRSTNGGTSWSSDVALQTKKNSIGVYACLATNGSVVNIVYQGILSQNSYDIIYNKSTNNGSTWGTEVQLTTNGQYAAEYASIAVSGSSLHVVFVDHRNLNPEIYYKRNLSGLGRPIEITETNSMTPNVYSLSQNYPNPFNPSTTIKFALPNTGFAKLVVYDALGRVVETLVNEQLNAGTYEAVWSADKYSSGVYFYTLTSGAFTQTNRMLMVK